jgi:inosine-uridine nucleoside N-ribohydrolase
MRQHGDDAARARNAFRGMSQNQMEQMHGDSGMSRRSVLEEYERRDREIEAAIAWVRSVAEESGERAA